MFGISLRRANLHQLAVRFFSALVTRGNGSLLRRLATLDNFPGVTAYSPLITDAFCACGGIDVGLALLERNIKELVRSSTPAARVTASRFLFHNSPPKPIDRTHKLRCLDDVIAALSPANVRPFLVFGTLLGFVRESDFMPHDMDLDIGILADEASCPLIRDLLKAAGFAITLYQGPNWPCRLKCRHPNSFPVDVVFFKEEGGFLFTYMLYLGQMIVRKRTYFNLAQVDFLGRQVWIPETPELFLEENYGDWRNPADFFDCLLSSRLTDFSHPIVRYKARRLFYRVYTNGEIGKVHSLLCMMNDMDADDPFWQWLNTRLRPDAVS